MVSENATRLAVLIDADNAQPSITEGLLAEVACPPPHRQVPDPGSGINRTSYNATPGIDILAPSEALTAATNA